MNYQMLRISLSHGCTKSYEIYILSEQVLKFNGFSFGMKQLFKNK